MQSTNHEVLCFYALNKDQTQLSDLSTSVHSFDRAKNYLRAIPLDSISNGKLLKISTLFGDGEVIIIQTMDNKNDQSIRIASKS